MQILNWKIEPVLKKEIDEHYRTNFALSIKNEPVISIVRKITFDGVAPNITIEDVKVFMDYVNETFLSKGIKGVGLEVGGGCGFFSALLASYQSVERIYSVEVCENIVRELMPKVTEEVAGEHKAFEKVIGCVGDFDHIELPDASIDFVFDFYSLHHSSDIKKTFTEICRVLKPGGFIFCFDKTRANSLTDEGLKKLLDTEYSSETKKTMGLPPNVFHTRRMNGEKEYRLKDWQDAFLKAGFKAFRHYHVARIKDKGFFYGNIKISISLLPVSLQTRLTSLLSRGGNGNNLEQSHKIYTPRVNNFPKEISLMVVWK
jgi:ubiquinone/menaquinone biosynthesis C-methylase UbiE